MDLLGYGDLSHFNDITSVNIASVKVSPFRILAYQKVCSDFYRASNYESNRISSYNIDSPLSISAAPALFTNAFFAVALPSLEER